MSLDPTGAGRKRWTMRWKPALNAIAVPSRPDVHLALFGPPGVTVPGTYPARVQVSNLGNIVVEGQLHGERGSAGLLMPELIFPVAGAMSPTSTPLPARPPNSISS